MSALDVVHTATWVIAVAAVVIALYRVVAGPTLLDRVVANDVLTAGAIGVCAVMVVAWSRPDLMTVILALVLTSFLTAVVVSRFALGEKARERRILNKHQAARQIQQREEAARVAEQAELEQAIAQAEQADSAEQVEQTAYQPDAADSDQVGRQIAGDSGDQAQGGGSEPSQANPGQANQRLNSDRALRRDLDPTSGRASDGLGEPARTGKGGRASDGRGEAGRKSFDKRGQASDGNETRLDAHGRGRS